MDLSKLVIPKPDSMLTSIQTSGKGTPKDGSKKSTAKGSRAKTPPKEEDPLPDYYELDLPEVNYIEHIA